jgi:type IX secretion system PorP/SprF family membrane protein
MKNILTVTLLFFGMSTLKSQQIGLTSQYLFNDFSINPAIAGTKSYSPLSISFRRQWMGIDGAPVTQNLMYHTFLGESAGIGGHVFNDVSGPSRRSGFNTTFAYNIKTSKETNLSFGIAGSLSQFSISRDRLITEIPYDIAIVNLNNSLIGDCNFGIYWSGVRHFFGVSAYNLFENKTNITALTSPITNTLDRVFYAHGGYNFKIGAII